MVERTQLERLARPFPKNLIHDNPSGGGSYVKHSVVTEKLLAVVGPFDFELVEVVRGDVAARPANPSAKSARGRSGSPALSSSVCGAVCRLTVEVDGRVARIEEVGDCEDPHNWPHDGARLKDAMSDALKRCAMRLGVTLHLWSGPEFSLYEQLKAQIAEGMSQGNPHVDDSGETAARESTASPSVSSSLAPGTGRVGDAGTAGSVPAPPAVPATSKLRQHNLKVRCQALADELADGGVSVADAREKLKLPLVDSCNDVQLAVFETMMDALEAENAAKKVRA